MTVVVPEQGQLVRVRMRAGESKGEVRRRATEMFDAVEHIHARGLPHGDLHAGNVLIVNGAVKVIDILYMTGETLAAMGTSSVQDRLHRDLIGLARMVSDMVCFSDLRDRVQEGLRQALVQAKTVAEQREALGRFCDTLAVDERSEDDARSAAPAAHQEPPTLDDLVLKAVCEQVLESGHVFVTVKELLARLPDGTPADGVKESLEILDGQFLIEAQPSTSGIHHLKLVRHGFESYAESYYADYPRIAADVRRLVGEEKATTNNELAHLLSCPRVVVDFALDALEFEGLCKLGGATNGSKFAHHVSAKLRREVRGAVTEGGEE